MREIRMSGSEGGGIRNQLILPTRIKGLSTENLYPPPPGLLISLPRISLGCFPKHSPPLLKGEMNKEGIRISPL
jgi:hypothetical protein